MKESKGQMSKIIITLVCIVIIVISVISIGFSIEVMSNKNGKTQFSEIGSTETAMLEKLQSYLKENNLLLDKPVAFVKNNGFMRGRAYVFNVKLTENKSAYNMQGGTYGTEILLPESFDLPTMYRCCTFAPEFGSLLFPSDYKTTKLFGEQVYVISFNDNSLSDGSFITLLDRMYGR